MRGSAVFALFLRNRRGVYAVLRSLSIALTLALASLLPPWDTLERQVFDRLTVLTAPNKSSLPITIIGIDEASFTQIGKRWPWPRSLFGEVVDKLSAAGAAAIVFDMVFYEESAAAEDDAFAAAIKRAGNVVLAADHSYHETSLIRQWIRVDPLPKFLAAGALPGLATTELDADAVVRRMPQQPDAMWRAVARAVERANPGLIPQPEIGYRDLVRHLGPAHTFPYVSFYQVLAGDRSLPPDFFDKQIILIGRDVRASPEATMAQSDVFSTPFVSVSKLLTPGVEIQATFLENAIAGRTIEPATRAVALAAIAALVLLVLPALLWWHVVWSSVWSGVLVLGTAGLAYWLFAAQDYWLPVVAPLFALALAYLTTAGFSYLAERRRALKVKFAFSRYVSRHIVDEIVADPDSLRAGGEKRELTLLFSDLQGFTSISEKLSPEAVAQLVNDHLTLMTRVIHRHQGTVSKFIGDGIFAFWGAPLQDPEHARHACEAAREMQAEMRKMSEAFVAAGGVPLRMRVGLHTGPAIVGNMGSDERFDFTALGDNVNLAARLEGANKAYGTLTLISAATAEKLGSASGLRAVDRIRVKGKDVPISVFTPCDDGALIRLSEEALEAYYGQQWDAATARWRAVLEHAPADTVAPVFLERIVDFRAASPGAGWDGSVALEKL